MSDRSRYRVRKDEVVKSRVAEFVEMEGRAAGGRLARGSWNRSQNGENQVGFGKSEERFGIVKEET
jgi:hypothetical protein